MNFVEVNGTRLAWESWGEGPAIVLVGGMGMDLDVWRTTYVDGLVAAGYRAVAICPPGTPPSGAPAGECTIFSIAGDFNAAIAQLGIDECFVLGVCLGALVAQELALTAPAGKRGLALVAPTGRVTRWTRMLTDGELALQDKKLPFTDGYVVASDLLQLMSAGELTDDNKVERMARRMAAASEAEQQARRILLSAMRDYGNRLDALRDLRVPTLLVSFAQDMLTPAALAAELAGSLPAATHICIDGAGHFGIFGKCDHILQETIAFFSKLRS
jgi:pimeloyl-ACP methyl ester carboxylesterase